MSYEITHHTRTGRAYDPAYAQLRAYQKRKYSRAQGKKIVSDATLRTLVEEYLFDDQSPEMIAGRIRYHHRDVPRVSGILIRRYIKSPYGRTIESHRLRLQKKYRRRHPPREYSEGKRMITTRPRYINTRARIGDTEGDFIVSGKSGEGIILNVTDRKSRAPFLEKIWPVSIRSMENAFKRIKKRFPEMKTMTLDNDILFIHHKRLEELLGITIYFCHKHSPWEKGTNENRNKIMRIYIPKRSNIAAYSRVYIRKLEERLQRRIMKCLQYATPAEVLEMYRAKEKKKKSR